MMSCLWHAGLVIASLWGPADILDAMNSQFRFINTEKTTLPEAVIGVAGSLDDRPIERIGVEFGQELPIVTQVVRTPVLAPIAPGQRPACDNPPDRAEILRALPPLPCGMPFVYEEYRDNLEFVVEKLVDRVDPPRFFPLIGPAQLHHCHWKCVVYFTQTTDVAFPLSYTMRARRVEVVYINKSRLHLCADHQRPEQRPAPMSCPAGGKAAAKSAPKIEHAPQIQMDVIVAQVNRTALPNVIFRWAENQKGSITFGLLPNQDGFTDVLEALRSVGLADIISQPKLMTLDGRPGRVSVLTQVAIPTCGSNPTVSYKEVGHQIELLPTIKADGKIDLEFRLKITSLNPAKDTTIPGVTPTTIPGFNTRSDCVNAEMELGKTLVIGGLIHDQTTQSVMRIPVLADLPGIGGLFTWSYPQETKQEVVVFITPRLVKAWGGAETSEPPTAIPTKAERSNRLTLDDVIALSKRGLSPRIIVRQMEIANASFDLTVDDLIRLAENSVDEEIISAMQELRR